MTYCANDPCEAEATTECGPEGSEKPYCHTCAQAYRRGYDDGWEDGVNDEEG